MERTTLPVIRYLVPALLGLALVGCGDKNNSPAAGQLNVAQVAPYVPTTTSVLLDGQAQKNLFYGQYSGYSEVSAGSHTLQVQDASNAVVAVSVPLTVDSRKYYSVYIYNSSPTQLAALSLTDDRALPSPGKANLRFINLGYGVANVTLLRQGAPGKPLAADVGPKENTGFITVDPQGADDKPLTLEVRSANNSTVLATQQLKITNDKLYNVVLRGVAPTANSAGSLTLDAAELQ